MHLGDRECNVHTGSSPIATSWCKLQATGVLHNAQGRAAELERQLHAVESRASQIAAEATESRQQAADAQAAAQAEASQYERQLAQQQVCLLGPYHPLNW